MYNFVVTRGPLQCSTQCLSESDCFSFTLNAGGTNCALFSKGTTIYDFTGLLTYAVQEKRIKVQIN